MSLAPRNIRYHAYVLADRLLAMNFKSALFDHIFDRFASGTYAGYPLIRSLFLRLTAFDPMAQLFVDGHCINNAIHYYTEPNELPQDFLMGILRKMHAMKASSDKEKVLKRDDYKI